MVPHPAVTNGADRRGRVLLAATEVPRSTATKTDPGAVASLTSALVDVVDGRNLAAIIPALPGLLNDKLGISPSGDFQYAFEGALHTVVTELRRIVREGRTRRPQGPASRPCPGRQRRHDRDQDPTKV